MNPETTTEDIAPLAIRLRRHVADLLRLSAPVVVARAGIMVMAFVDTAMVGRLSAHELAYLGIGLAPITTVLLTGIGLMMGTLVLTASAFGAERFTECGAVWRRSLGYALALGVAGAVICGFGEPLLAALGQPPDLAAGGGPVAQVVGLGLAAQLVFVTTTFFLEGIKRPVPGMVMMIAANVINVFLNWVLIYGHLGFPAMGALGSAWATTGVRVFLAVGLVAYVWTMADHARFGVRMRPAGGWKAWAEQRRIGFAAGASIGSEAVAFSTAALFAGHLGVLPAGVFSIALNLLSLVFMVAIGFGAATSVSVGIAHGRGNYRDLALAGWTGLGLNTAAMAAFGVAFALAPETLAGLYTTEAALLAASVPAVSLVAWVLVVDGGQALMANALRGRGETWVPTGMQAFSYFGVMVPVCWVLAFPVGNGVYGIWQGVLVASVVAMALLVGRFYWLTRLDRAEAMLSGAAKRS